jgi:hypothetical protein
MDAFSNVTGLGGGVRTAAAINDAPFPTLRPIP